MHRTKRQTLGQHFLVSRSHVERIIGMAAPGPDETIVEIGPGRGALTLPLAARAARIIAVEKDAVLADRLRLEAPPNVEIMTGDALEFDFAALRDKIAPEGLKVVGNLPYGISTPFMSRILCSPSTFRECLFMVQKEFAERLLAGPGGRGYAPPAVLTSLYYEAGTRLKVPPGAFAPPPKVDSVVIHLRRRPGPLFAVGDEKGFRAFLDGSFSERRKTLWNNLIRSIPAERLSGAFDGHGIPRNVRAEDLPVESFVRLFLSARNGARPVL